MGRAIAGRREEVVIESKVAPQPHGSGFRPDEVHRACEASLARMDLDVIDLYQLHWPGHHVDSLQQQFSMLNRRDSDLIGWCGEQGVGVLSYGPLAQLALGWNVKQPGVTSAIAGSRDPAHVRTNAEAGDLQLDDATLAEIDRLLG